MRNKHFRAFEKAVKAIVIAIVGAVAYGMSKRLKSNKNLKTFKDGTKRS